MTIITTDQNSESFDHLQENLPPFGEEIHLPDELLAKYWRATKWEHAENLLVTFQYHLAIAAKRHIWDEVRFWQRAITDEIEIKKLAVRQATADNPSPGVDGIRWVTDAQKMRGAINLRSEHYKAVPLRHIIIYDRNKSKERNVGIPAIRDRAMQVLHAYALNPVAESLGDRKSFAFRRGRSQLDAHYYILDGLTRKNPPEWLLLADVKAFYDNIDHQWVIDHIPMRKNVLREFLRSGILFQPDERINFSKGISLGTSLSPIIANMVLDNLEWRMFALQPAWKYNRNLVDYSDGNMVRFADDIFITARSCESAILFKLELEKFLAERSLSLSDKKTKIVHLSEGFEYLSRRYILENGKIHCYPSDKARDNFINNISDFIFNAPVRWSQDGLIKSLNKRLHGFASYHRITEASRVFQYIDVSVNALLLKLLCEYYHRKSIKTLKSQFWYEDEKGRFVFTLEGDKSKRILQLEDVVLITHPKLYTNANPYIDREYFASRFSEAESKVSGKFKTIWQRQSGRCYICHKAIKSYEERQLMKLDLRRGNELINLAYVHSSCLEREFFTFHSDKYIDNINILEVAQALKDRNIVTTGKIQNNARLESFFSDTTKAKLTMTIKAIEELLDEPLPEIAYIIDDYWSARHEKHISNCWQKYGFSISKIDLKRKKITFARAKKIPGKIKIPDKLKGNDLPEALIYEVNNHFAYLIKKYGL